MNRVTNAGTLSTCTTGCWSITFSPDQWGNVLSATGTGAAATASFGIQINTANQITSSPFTYDAAGNLLTDVTSTYAWNGEGQMKTGGGVGYLYDGNGNRVEKPGEKLYWYGPDGEVLDETDTTGSTSNAAFSEYVYLAGQRVARSDYENNVYYYFEDQVGSSREIAEIPSSGSATLCYDADFFPYGGEDVFTNTCAQNYKFTGKERDAETNNDNFGARYFSSTYGRFLSPDPANAGADPTNPQSWNMYSYVLNNPLVYTDPTGLYCSDQNGNEMVDDQGNPISTDPQSCANANGQWITVDGQPNQTNTVTVNAGPDPVSAAALILIPIPTTLSAPSNPMKTCTSNAHGVYNNLPTTHPNQPGAYGVPETPGTAAIDRSQWLPPGSNMTGVQANTYINQYRSQISGYVPNGQGGYTQVFNGVSDNIGPPSSATFLENTYPGRVLFELPGGPNLGNVNGMQFQIPSAMSCPNP